MLSTPDQIPVEKLMTVDMLTGIGAPAYLNL